MITWDDVLKITKGGNPRPPARIEKTAEQWKELAATADETAKQWKHDYLGTEHLLMALIADGTLTKQFLSEQGIEAATVRDMAIRIYFSPGRDATAVRPLPKQ